MTDTIKAVPEGFTEIDLGMSNWDHSIDEGFEERLRTESAWGWHAAWDFAGRVWFENGMFHEQVWCYGSPVAHYEAPDLKALMDMVSDCYGWK